MLGADWSPANPALAVSVRDSLGPVREVLTPSAYAAFQLPLVLAVVPSRIPIRAEVTDDVDAAPFVDARLSGKLAIHPGGHFVECSGKGKNAATMGPQASGFATDTKRVLTVRRMVVGGPLPTMWGTQAQHGIQPGR